MRRPPIFSFKVISAAKIRVVYARFGKKMPKKLKYTSTKEQVLQRSAFILVLRRNLFKRRAFGMNKKLRGVLIVFLSCVLLYSFIHIVLTQTEYEKAERIYEKSRQESFHVSDGAQELVISEEKEEYFPDVTVDFDELKKINPDIIGWLWIPGTNISFPLLLTGDNLKYLNLSYDLQYTNSGSIFMDYRSSSDFSDDNTLIYGHNMHSGGMFGELKKFANPDYLSQNRGLYIFTGSRVYKYRIFAAYITENDSKSYTRTFTEDFSYDDFLEYIAAASESASDAPEDTAALVTLSTCTSVQRDERFVVHAYLEAKKP